MGHIRPQRRVLNGHISCVSDEAAATPVYSDTIVRVPIEHPVNQNICTANDVHAVAIAHIAHALDVPNGHMLRPAGENLPAKDSANFDVFRICGPHSTNRLIQHTPAQNADIFYSTDQNLASEDRSPGDVDRLSARYS